MSENSRAQKHAETQAAARLRLAESDVKPRSKSISSDSSHAFSDGPALATTSSVVKHGVAEHDLAKAQLCKELDLSAFKHDIRISFTVRNILAGAPQSVDWLYLGYDKPGFEVSSEALRAISCAYFGRMKHIRQSEAEGVMLYGKTLKALSHAIASKQATSVTVLTGSMICAAYEMIASGDHNSSLSHTRGIAQLIELRGPESHQSQIELLVFASIRHVLCSKGLVDRKKIFLEREEWKTVPWSLLPERKTMLEKITDVLCATPGLVQRLDEVLLKKSMTEQYNKAIGEYKVDLYKCFRSAYEWRAAWEEMYPNVSYEATPTFLSPFATCIRYQKLEFALGIAFYNAILLIITMAGVDIWGQSYDHCLAARDLPYSTTNPSLLSPGVSTRDSALEIIRSAEYHLTGPHASAGAFYLVMPLKVAWDAMPKDTLERFWIEQVMIGISRESGFKFTTGVLKNFEHGHHY